jgi:hypothetical protein
VISGNVVLTQRKKRIMNLKVSAQRMLCIKNKSRCWATIISFAFYIQTNLYPHGGYFCRWAFANN